MSAAYYLELMGHHAVVFEQKSQLGGMLRYGIPNYRFPRERLDEDIEAILSTGVEVHTNANIGNGENDIPLSRLREDFDAVYIAIGAHTDKKIGMEGILDLKWKCCAISVTAILLILQEKELSSWAVAMSLWTAPVQRSGWAQARWGSLTADARMT